ncbi:hypothetical protein KR084_002925 [Drosophila pseudotakahashii]|nr:hypothetical protein KR084_002925 [Drosophila pseudotakahashii]
MQALCIVLFAIGLCQILASTQTCFDTYLPLKKEVADTYEADLNECLKQAYEDRLNIQFNFKVQLDLIKTAVSFFDDIFGNCSTLDDILQYLDCISAAGEQSSNIIIKIITVNAANLENAVSAEYSLIDVNEFACRNATERAYVENSAKLYADLQKCLLGN